MINLNTQAQLNTPLSNTSKVLTKAIKNATPEQLETLKETKDLKSLLAFVFQDKITASKTDTVLLDILKNLTPFKTMRNLSENLESLLKDLKTSSDFSPKIAVLEKFLKNINLLDAQTLKTQIVNSGVFMESKFVSAIDQLSDPTQTLKQLTNTIKGGDTSKDPPSLITNSKTFSNPKEFAVETFLRESMANDLKSNLLSLREELTRSNDTNTPTLIEQTDKLLAQIDYYQLTSVLSSSNSLYIPFTWDQLESGSMTFKKTADKKFYCEINLSLKEYGELNLMMALYEGNQLEIQIHTQTSELKTLLHDNIGELRSLLIGADLTPRSIRILKMRDTPSPLNETYAGYEYESNLGFEVKV